MPRSKASPAQGHPDHERAGPDGRADGEEAEARQTRPSAQPAAPPMRKGAATSRVPPTAEPSSWLARPRAPRKHDAHGVGDGGGAGGHRTRVTVLAGAPAVRTLGTVGDDDGAGRQDATPDPASPAVDARRVSRRRGAIATGAAVLALGGAMAKLVIKAASDGLRRNR